MRRLLLIALVLFAGSAVAFQPRTGHWLDPAHPGRGFNIDIQDGVIVLTVYAYGSAGNAQWYLASGNMTNNQHNFTGTLDRYVNGQCAGCGYRQPTLAGNDGLVSIAFTSEVSAVLTLPGSDVSVIQPFNFKIGNPPDGLFGEWVFTEDINGVTFANRYDLTTLLAPTASGNGIATDVARLAGCELQLVGAYAGAVVCADTNTTGALENGFLFVFGLDETFQGVYVAPSGGQFAMKGFKVVSRNGYVKAAERDTGSTARAAAERDTSSAAKAAAAANAATPQASAELMGALRSLAQRLATRQ